MAGGHAREAKRALCVLFTLVYTLLLPSMRFIPPPVLREGAARSFLVQLSRTSTPRANVFLRRYTQTSGHEANGGSNNSRDHKTTHFGFQTVPEEAKETLVKGVFSSVAANYDLMNDAMSLGVHRLWKDTFVVELKPGKRGAIRCLDVAGGTGDIALRILDYAREKYYDRETSVQVLDINPEMLKEGKRRFKQTMYHNSMPDAPLTSYCRLTDKLEAPQVSFTEGNAQDLQLPSDTYDLYTIAFGIRNCTNIPDVLKEAYRVLKPGGVFACLEFSKVTNPVFASYVSSFL